MRKNLINLFLEKNKEINLSAIRDYDWVLNKHILDSIELNNFFKFKKNTKVCDIGTGWGFPLLPLAISNKDVNFIWIDARKKKVNAVNDIIMQAKIQNAVCEWTRIEDCKKKFDYVTARAVAHVEKLIPWTIHLLKDNWYLILYKEEKNSEYESLKNLCIKYKLKIEKAHKYSLFEWDINRVIYIIKK